ncbi:hypothetical protein [Bradyrhizobium japonicum]|uniref:hypothetical protein n=1 Tax=Bradyrhizobium japonicum TaxID=375 RepID=UPI0012FD3B8B|nr:hypothetical protein [Bradyrhizobium japonicum]
MHINKSDQNGAKGLPEWDGAGKLRGGGRELENPFNAGRSKRSRKTGYSGSKSTISRRLIELSQKGSLHDGVEFVAARSDRDPNRWAACPR